MLGVNLICGAKNFVLRAYIIYIFSTFLYVLSYMLQLLLRSWACADKKNYP